MGNSPSRQFNSAVKKCDVKSVQLFLKQKSPLQIEDVLGKYIDGCSVLHWAVKHGNIDLVETLLDAGCDPNCGSPLAHVQSIQTPSNKWTPLHEACKQGKEDIVLVLLKNGAGNNVADSASLTPLGVATYCGHTSVLTALVENGWSVDEEVSTVEGETALVYAVRAGDFITTKHLLLLGARLNCRAWDSTRPLMYCQCGVTYKGMTYQQLSQSFDKSLSILTLAIRNVWLDIARLLVVHGFNINKYSIVDVIRELKTAVGVIDGECYQLVELYVSAGYQKRTQDETILAQLEEKDSRDHFRSFPDNFLGWVTELVLREPSLMELCRTCIRTRLRVCGGQRSLWTVCYQLGLPPSLASYIALQQYVPESGRAPASGSRMDFDTTEYRISHRKAKKQRHVYIQFWQASCCFWKH